MFVRLKVTMKERAPAKATISQMMTLRHDTDRSTFWRLSESLKIPVMPDISPSFSHSAFSFAPESAFVQTRSTFAFSLPKQAFLVFSVIRRKFPM